MKKQVDVQRLRLQVLANAITKFKSQHIIDRKPRRFHISKWAGLTVENLNNIPQTTGYKPRGVWYGIDYSWINWCLAESFDGIHKFIYEVEINKSRILPIVKMLDFEKFENEHGESPKWMEGLESIDGYPFDLSLGKKNHLSCMMNINYRNVAENFGGVEISPYRREKRLESMWYYGWDCASGCIWNPDAIKSLRLFAYFDEQKCEFIKIGLQQGKNKV